MKKLNFITLFVFISCTLIAQETNKNFFISLTGKHIKGQSGQGGIINSYSSANKQTDLTARVGYKLSSHFNIGIGLDFINQKETRQSNLILSDQLAFDETKLKGKGYLPFVFFAYNKNIIQGLSAQISLNIGYGKQKMEIDSKYGSYQYSSSYYDMTNANSPNGFQGFNDDAEANLFRTQLSPELFYFFKNGLGATIKLGGILYEKADVENSESQWVADFSPKNWQFGFAFQF